MSKLIRKLKFLFLPLLSATGILVSAAFPVYAADRVQYDNTIHLGKVDITISTIGKDNKSLSEDETSVLVVPGETVEDTVTLHNKGENAWVRIRPTLSGVRGMDSLDESMLNIAGNDWKKCGNYWYYTKPLKKGKDIDYIKSISIPTSWTEYVSDKNFTVRFEADAIQEDNFNPDFSSDDPWFGTVIEHFNQPDAEDITKTDRSFIVLYRGGAEGFVKTDDDFFSNWGILMPGDTESGSVDLKNEYTRGVSLSFSSETLDQDLASKIDLSIQMDGKEIFNGKMSDAALNDLALVHLNPGDTSHHLTYTVHIPETITNEYALASTTTRWIFTAKLDPAPSQQQQPERRNGDAKTGDSPTIFWLAGFGAGCCLMGVATGRAKKKRDSK